MNKEITLIIIALGFLIIACKQEKGRTLDVVRLCLEAQNETSLLFNQRNLNLQKIVETKKTDNQDLDKSNLAEIDTLNIQISKAVNIYLNELKLEKEKFSDNTLLNEVINHLESLKKFEKKFGIYLTLIKDTIVDNELEISETITNLALTLKSETNKLKNTKEVFYEKYKIEQRQIDSILDLIEK
ncbi:hypothetical protein [uncultured Maribacter sp.]|uniref:hypothetical protein n=1 Tax=uncultured Maribacter sp. TaxID=431308 RepID=UPI00262F93A7|nr:hypothetical protein [uncultured Maribacter sp.]